MLSLNAVCAVNTGSYGSPVWVAQTWIKDLKLPLDFDKHESSMRGTGGVKTNQPTLLDITVSGSGMWLPGDTQFSNFMTRHMGRTPIEYAFADQAVANSGCRYVRATCCSFKADRNENLGENLTCDFELGLSAFNADGTVATAPSLVTT